MGRKFWGSLGLLASVLVGAGSAGAADLAVKAPVYKAPPVYLSDWSGFYLGVNGGYGWGKTTFDAPFGFADASPKGGLVGGHAGYNWQYGSIVTGLEVDFDAADITATDTLASGERCRHERCVAESISRTMKFDELATARARLGYTVLPNLLAYGTAGAAWGHSTLTGTLNVGQNSFSADANANNFGWVAGGGLEYKVWGNFIARAEYLHYDFAKTAYSFPILLSPNAGSTVDVARGGLSYKF
jgi:outer membrane immunogenic protein